MITVHSSAIEIYFDIAEVTRKLEMTLRPGKVSGLSCIIYLRGERTWKHAVHPLPFDARGASKKTRRKKFTSNGYQFVRSVAN